MEKHNLRYTRIYGIWCGIKNRCNCKTSRDYKNYGAKGIKICKKWKLFSGFYSDMFDSYKKHEKIFGEKDTTIDRKDYLKGYNKQNCRWATKKEQAINKNNDSWKKKKRDKNGRFIKEKLNLVKMKTKK